MDKNKIIDNLTETLKKPIFDKSMKANIEGKLQKLTLGVKTNK